MYFISYSELKNKLSEYINRKCHIINEITENEETIKVGISDIKEVYLNDFVVLNYTENDLKLKKNIIIKKDDKPIIKLSEYKNNKKEIEYEETEYTIFKEDSDRIKNKLELSIWQKDSTKVIKVKMLELKKENVYFKNRYEVYYDNEEIISIKKQDLMFLKNDIKFNDIEEELDTRLRNVTYSILNKFNETINSEDIIREYSIKRNKSKGLTKII